MAKEQKEMKIKPYLSSECYLKIELRKELLLLPHFPKPEFNRRTKEQEAWASFMRPVKWAVHLKLQWLVLYLHLRIAKS